MFLNASSNISGFLIPEEKKESSLLYEPVATIALLVLPNILNEVDKLQDKDENPETRQEK
jgi:membrane protein required for colicin V production